MKQNRQRLAGGLWLLAGLPILASFVQAAIALMGASATSIPVIGGVKRSVQSVAVLDAAGNLFRSSPSIVLVLFVFVTVAWLAQGAGMFVLTNRVFTLGATGFVTLFVVLFELVYLPLLSAGLPSGQTIAFLSVPILVAAALWASTLVFEWDVTLDDDTSGRLADAREDARRERQAFEDHVEATVPEDARELLREFAPDAVETFEQDAAAFTDECQSVVDTIETLSDDRESVSSRERNERAEQVLSDAKALDGQKRAERLCSTFERSLVKTINAEFGEFQPVSRYGRSYEFRNLRTYNELRLPMLDCPPVQIGGAQHELGEQIAAAVGSQGLASVAAAIERSGAHLSQARSVIDEHESAVATRLDEVDDILEIARDHIDGLDGEARERLHEFLFEGRTPEAVDAVQTVVKVREQQDEAKGLLHRAQFEDAERAADEAVTKAQQIEEIAEFFADSVGSTIEYGSGSIPVPPTVGTGLVSQLRVPFERSYAIEYEVDGDTLNITAADDGATTQTQESRELVNNTDDDDVQADDVLYVLRELKSAAANSDVEGTVELQTEQLPEKFIRSDVLREIKRFAQRQSDVTGVTVPADPPPGFLSIEVSDSVSPQRAMTELQDRYASSQN